MDYMDENAVVTATTMFVPCYSTPLNLSPRLYQMRGHFSRSEGQNDRVVRVIPTCLTQRHARPTDLVSGSIVSAHGLTWSLTDFYFVIGFFPFDLFYSIYAGSASSVKAKWKFRGSRIWANNRHYSRLSLCIESSSAENPFNLPSLFKKRKREKKKKRYSVFPLIKKK